MAKYIVAAAIFVLLIIGVWYWMAPKNTPPPELDIRFGFIRAVETEGGQSRIVFDRAEWLSGRDAEDAAIAAGHCTETTRQDCLPNDFFILNDSTSTETLTVAAEPVIAMQTLNMEQEGVKETQITFQEFTNLIGNAQLRWTKVPYQLLVEGGQVTIIEEVYVP